MEPVVVKIEHLIAVSLRLPARSRHAGKPSGFNLSVQHQLQEK